MTGPLAGGHLMRQSQNPSGKTVTPCIQSCNIVLMCIRCWARNVGRYPFPVSALCLKEGMTQLSKEPPEDAIVHSKGPREPFSECSLPFLRGSFFLEMWETVLYDQLLGATMLLWFDDGSSAPCLSTLYFPAFEFAGHNKALHVHRPERRIN